MSDRNDHDERQRDHPRDDDGTEGDLRKEEEDDRKKRRKNHHSRRDDEDGSASISSSDDDSRDRRKRKKRKHHKKKKSSKKKHRKKHYSSSEDDSASSDSRSVSSDSDDSYERRRRKKKKKKKREKKYDSSEDEKARKKKKKKKEKETDDHIPPGASFGKYGILRASDMLKQKRSFEVWMAEVKGIQSFTGPKWELQNYFAEYMEDYNTATLPHIKYYNYDDWEMKEYRRQEQLQKEKMSSGKVLLADEARHQEEMRKKAKEKQQAELELLRATMNKDKIQDMKHKAQLQSQMAHAFRTGDQETVKRIQRKLEPEPR